MEHALSDTFRANSFRATRHNGLAVRLGQVFTRLEFAFQVARERRQLMTLDTCALKDIGVSRADADGEARRKFWDLPSGR
jgi:uncharacterized protein YjiS (DUF1127 family)